MIKFDSWLWPNKQISKKESANLREEHNKLVNKHSQLAEFVQKIADLTDKDINLIGALNVEVTLRQLSQVAKEILE